MKTLLSLGLVAVLLAAGCRPGEHRSAGVFVLLNVAANHSSDPVPARNVIHYLLQTLGPADTLAAASIGTVGFSETDVIASVTFDQRPSAVNDQKRFFSERFDRFVASGSGSAFSDICGGMLQAIETLNRSGPDRKTILILSNLREKPTIGAPGDLPVHMTGINVVVLKASGLEPDSRDMKLYLRRVEDLRRKVEDGSGRLYLIDDLQQLEDILQRGPQAEGA